MAAVAAVLTLLSWLAVPALAVSRPRLTGAITDHSGAPGDLRADRTAALASGSGLSGGAEAAIAVGVAALLIGLAVPLRRRMSRPRRMLAAETDGTGPSPGMTIGDLDALASQALVETDDAIRTSDQELGFARARFGEQAAAPFAAALQSARLELAEAFRLRQLLDEGVPPTDATRRQYLTQIGARCAQASGLLDKQSEAFDQLQDLAGRAPQVLAEVDGHTVQQSARVGHYRQLLDRLAAKYTPQAVAAISTNPDQAAGRLAFAASGVTDARAALAERRTGEAAVLLQAAESAADQAADLLSAVEHLEAELTQAASALPAALREIDADVAEGAAMLAGRSGEERTGLLLTRAQEVAGDTRAQVASGPFDALAALREIEQADAALDHALAGARPAPTRRDRSRALLDQAMLVARSSVQAAEDFITTRRGGVAAPARTRLAEAQRHFRLAIGQDRQDPETALSEAEYADTLAQQARMLAAQDVGRFGDGQAAGPVRGTGDGDGVAGAMLGGILIDATLGRGRRGSNQGSTAGRTDAVVGPASFGGLGTRGRRGTAGQF